MIYIFIQLMLFIIVPYRNRKDNLDQFIEKVPQYLDARSIKYKIIIVEQGNDLQFNRGLLKNIGFDYASKHMNRNGAYFCFHDVDIIPNHSINYEDPKDQIYHPYGFAFCLGGIVTMNEKTFMAANGFPNNYWGYGAEDCTLLTRYKHLGIEIDHSKLIQRYHGTEVTELAHDRPAEDAIADKINCDMCYKEQNDPSLMYLNGLNNLKYSVRMIKEIQENIYILNVTFKKV
jgi:hypothetical protein